ncbi:MAG: DUF6452 family protein [Flavobacteriaceae bacterium]
MKKILLTVCLLAIVSCEPDDICSQSTQTTPRFVISFFDINDIENTKTVGGLYAVGLDLENNEVAITGEAVQSRPELKLPLDGSLNQTRFRLYKNYDVVDDEILGNPDEITIAYSTQTVYVSRACGYKNTYTIQGVSIDSDNDLWTISTEILLNEVTNENETHIKIFH